MGLDMYLFRHKNAEKVSYWRKADQIRNWFVRLGYPADGNCDHLSLCKELLEDLISDCKKVLDNHDLAKAILPCEVSSIHEQDDGSYDDWYYLQLEQTVEQVQDVIDKTDWETESVYYTDWW